MATTVARKPANRLNGKLPSTNGNGHEVIKSEIVKVIPLRQKTIKVRLVGLSPYLQAKFSEKARQKIMDTQTGVIKKGTRTAREPRDYDADYEGATHYMKIGKEMIPGVPASAFRNACISACRLVGFQMTKAKLAIFTEADGFDVSDGTPLVKINGKREKTIMPARNDNGGCDMRVRPMWKEWSIDLRMRFDEDQFSASDVINLLIRVGAQVGIGEGRPDSRESNGMGYGLFEVKLAEE